MTEVDVQCADCRKPITSTADVLQYWDWTNNYNPRRHLVCADCYAQAKALENAKKRT